MWRSILTRDQVILAERPAWAHGYRYYYDGINFWKRTIMGQQVAPLRTPMEGWRHKGDCRCEFCSCPGSDESDGDLTLDAPTDVPPKDVPPPEVPPPDAPATRTDEDDLSSGGRAL